MELRSIFAGMIERLLSPLISSALGQFPAVALLGPRQVGKTTLAIELGEKLDAQYLDLESDQDLIKLEQPE